MESEDDQAFRRAMSAFATGVTVVTAAKEDGACVGITVNSLTSVSLKPRLMLWCLGDRSARYETFATARDWGVTVLGADEEALARRFASAENEIMAPGEAETFAGVPVLRAGVAHFACRTHQTQQMGDHLIIAGEVVDLRSSAAPALTFFRGRYGRIE